MKRLILSTALLLTAGQAVHAHTSMSKSTPADQAVLDSAPEEIVLNFSEAVRLTALSIQQAGGKKQDLGPLPTEASERFAAAAPTLAAGQYLVSWRAVSADTHVLSGEIRFTVEGAASH